MSMNDKRKVNPTKEITRIAQDNLQLPLRGFKESYRSSEPGKIIYDSKWCRLNIIWDGWDYLVGNSINIRYGRLHAVNEKVSMTWNGEECRCWHRVEYPLHFLDKRTPQEAADLNYSHPLIKPFHEEEFHQKFYHRQPELVALIHVTIWEHYGQPLFELFDINQPDIWQQYRQFLKEVYDIEGRFPEIKPSMDKVC